jgi:hypothetical protein
MESILEWLQKQVEHYWSNKNDMSEALESKDLDKLRQGFMMANLFEEVYIGDGYIPRPSFVKE